jgi:hypothetical protein
MKAKTTSKTSQPYWLIAIGTLASVFGALLLSSGPVPLIIMCVGFMFFGLGILRLRGMPKD